MSTHFFTRSATVVLLSSLCPALLLLSFGGGCKRSTTVRGPEGERATFTQKGEGMDVSVEGKDGKKAHLKTGENVPLPEDFPKDVAIYPKAAVVMSMTGDKGKQVTLKTADSVQKVEAFYKERLKADGWEIKGSMNMPQLTMLSGLKEYHTLTISITSDSGETMITISLGETQ